MECYYNCARADFRTINPQSYWLYAFRALRVLSTRYVCVPCAGMRILMLVVCRHALGFEILTLGFKLEYISLKYPIRD